MSAWARWRVAWTFARRDLRGGLGNFRVFLLALALGVAGLAIVGSLAAALRGGLETRGAELLGGDIEIELVYRFASESERAAMAKIGDVSETVDLRSKVRSTNQFPLVQAKAVDNAYPLIGQVVLDRPMSLEDALKPDANGRYGAVVERSLLTRLGEDVGAIVRFGAKDFEIRAVIENEPDRAISGLNFGPRFMVSVAGLRDANMATEGTLFETEYRIRLPNDAALDDAVAALKAAFPESGWRLRDKRNGAPGVERGVSQIGGFLTLVALAALAVGGVGVGGSVRNYLDKKTEAIATLKTLGADGATVLRIFLMQIALVATLGVAIGLAAGAATVLVFGPGVAEALGVPSATAIYAKPLFEAALYGFLTAFLFALWPLARAKEIRAAGLFRDSISPAAAWPRPVYIGVTVLLAATLGFAAIVLAENRILAQGFVGGVAVIFVVLLVAAAAVSMLARRLARGRIGRIGPAFRLALASLGGARAETRSAVLALGLGLTTLTAIGLIDANLRRFVSEQLPDQAADYFVFDIQKAEAARFRSEIGGQPGVQTLEMAPMLRGFITRLNGQTPEEWRAAGKIVDESESWVLRGDRGLTYAAAPPDRNPVVEGAWWPKNYTGEPLISFAAEEGRGLGLKIGDRVTVNVFGRDFTGRIAAFHNLNFRDGAMAFLMIFNPASLSGSPHSYLATVYGDEPVQGSFLRAISDQFPAATAVPTREIIERLAAAVGSISDAARYGALATLLTGLVVLAGAAAAGQRARIYEASIMKTMGAGRASLIAALVFRSALMGLAAGLVALVAGGVAAWAVTVFVFQEAFVFDAVVASTVLGVGLAATLLAGAVFAYGPLSARPARVLRARA